MWFIDNHSFLLVQILGLMVVRKLLDLMFSQHDLAWLDDILPDKDKKKKEDDKKRKKEKKVAEPESDEEVSIRAHTYTQAFKTGTRKGLYSVFAIYLNEGHSICYGFVIPSIGFLFSNTVCFSSLSHSVAEKALYNTYYCYYFLSVYSAFGPLPVFQHLRSHALNTLCAHYVLISVL